MIPRPRNGLALVFFGIGMATAAAHIGNNFTTYLIGGLIDRFGFTPVQMGAWSMIETLAYAASMFLIAPRVASLSPRQLLIVAGLLVTGAQLGSAGLSNYVPLLTGRVATGVGFGLANTALNLAAGRTDSPARALSIGIAIQTLLYALINIGLPMVGAQFGVAGMFCALAALSVLFTLPAIWLPGAPQKPLAKVARQPTAIGGDGWRVLICMALFTFGSLAIWPFMERAAHAIGLSAVTYGRYQGVATIASMLGNLGLAAVGGRLSRTLPLVAAFLVCGLSCAALTTVTEGWVFALALVVFNASWFVSYPLLMGIGYVVDHSGRLAVMSSAVWLLMMSLGSLATGITAQLFRGYQPVGPMGFIMCLGAILVIWPLARRLDAHPRLGVRARAEDAAT
jgi:predicted MFS family arabinose efflux permease